MRLTWYIRGEETFEAALQRMPDASVIVWEQPGNWTFNTSVFMPGFRPPRLLPRQLSCAPNKHTPLPFAMMPRIAGY